jgi:hypothetical protein
VSNALEVLSLDEKAVLLDLLRENIADIDDALRSSRHYLDEHPYPETRIGAGHDWFPGVGNVTRGSNEWKKAMEVSIAADELRRRLRIALLVKVEAL